MLVVKSENFATSSHLLCEDTGFVWSSTIPETAVFADTGQRSFAELAKIFGYNVESFISENYKSHKGHHPLPMIEATKKEGAARGHPVNKSAGHIHS